MMPCVTQSKTHPTQIVNAVFSIVTSRPSALHCTYNILHLRHILNKYIEAYVKHRKAICVYTNGLFTSCMLILQYKRQQFR
jgi:hypothetical protein